MEEFFSVAGWVSGDHYVASGATPPSEMAVEQDITTPRSLALPAPEGPAASGPAEPDPPLPLNFRATDERQGRKMETPGGAGRSTWERADQAVISESNGSSLSVTFALDSTKSVTLFSTTMASTSAMRERSDRYQRCTSTGFS